MNQAVKNFETELKNVQELTGEQTDLAKLWRTFITGHLSDIGEHTKTYLEQRSEVARKKLEAGLIKYDKLETTLKQAEGRTAAKSDVVPKAAKYQKHYDAQKEKEVALEKRKGSEKKDVVQQEGVVEAKQKELKDLRAQVKAAQKAEKKQAPGTPKTSTNLKKQKEDKEDELKIAKVKLETLKRVVSGTTREHEELYYDSVSQIVANLRKDQVTLRKYNMVIKKLEMPKVT